MPVNNSFQKSYKNLLRKNYPSVIKSNISSYPISSLIIPIPKKIEQKIKKIVQTLYQMTCLKNYIHCIHTQNTNLKNITHCLRSGLLMSYDFHWNGEENLYLIEVNTNSSGYLVSQLVDQVHGKKTKALSLLKKSFETEYNEYCLKKNQQIKSNNKQPSRVNTPSGLVIADHQIKKQKMYSEFLMYQDWIRSWGWPCKLHEISELSLHPNKKWLITQDQKKVDMIYNRCTDFYLKNYPNIKTAFLNNISCISPNPLEYLLLADKQRLCEWCDTNFLKRLNLSLINQALIKKAIPWTAWVSPLLAEKLWANRKQFFFKPLRGYGGRGVYRGKTITKKTFNNVIKELGIYQKIIPPGVLKLTKINTIQTKFQKWKYDIRAYAYKDQVQHLVARVYQGQLTNFQVPGAGFASIRID